jgi:hypothetical protein
MKWTTVICCVAAALLSGSCRTGGESGGTTPRNWPVEIGGRLLFSYDYGHVYARRRAVADQMGELITAVVKDAGQDGQIVAVPGLILVMDSGENPPIDVRQLFRIARDAGLPEAGQDMRLVSEAITRIREQVEGGIDPNRMLGLAPLPFAPSLLPRLVKGLPPDADQEVGWCLVVPTDQCVRTTLEQTIESATARESLSPIRQLMTTLSPMIERQAVEQMKKTRRALVYELLIHAQRDLSAEQKKAKGAAYEEKLDLIEGQGR